MTGTCLGLCGYIRTKTMCSGVFLCCYRFNKTRCYCLFKLQVNSCLHPNDHITWLVDLLSITNLGCTTHTVTNTYSLIQCYKFCSTFQGVFFPTWTGVQVNLQVTYVYLICDSTTQQVARYCCRILPSCWMTRVLSNPLKMMSISVATNERALRAICGMVSRSYPKRFLS